MKGWEEGVGGEERQRGEEGGGKEKISVPLAPRCLAALFKSY